MLALRGSGVEDKLKPRTHIKGGGKRANVGKGRDYGEGRRRFSLSEEAWTEGGEALKPV